MAKRENIFEKLHSGENYIPTKPELLAIQREYMDVMHTFNALLPSNTKERRKLCERMFKEFGSGSYLESPVYASFGGRHVKIGKDVYANFNLTLIDDTFITIGDYTMIGPNVTLATAAHPLNPQLRRDGYQYNEPIEIGENVWIGAGVTVLPGVRIGDNSVIGAGSVVTREVPANVLAMGVPCRAIRDLHHID